MTLLTPLYSGSFDSVGFFEQSESGFHPGRNIGTEGTLYSLRGGTHAYISMGRAAEPFTIKVGVDSAEHTALRAKRGVTGTLIWSRGTQTAKLLDILDEPGKAGAFDAYTITLRFFSTSLPAGVTPDDAWLTEGGEAWSTESGEPWILE